MPDGASRRRRWVAISAFALALILIPFSYKVSGKLETAVHIKGGEAEAVDSELAQRFQSPYAHRLIAVIKGLPDPDSFEGDRALDLIENSLRTQPGVSGVLSRLDWPDPLFLGKDGGTLLIVGLGPGAASEESLIPVLRTQAGELESQLRPHFPGISIQLTGESPLSYDLRKISADDVKRAETRVLPITLILLLRHSGCDAQNAYHHEQPSGVVSYAQPELSS